MRHTHKRHTRKQKAIRAFMASVAFALGIAFHADWKDGIAYAMLDFAIAPVTKAIWERHEYRGGAR